MIYPPGAIPLTQAQCIVSPPNFVALPCDDSVQNPGVGRRIMQFNVHVSTPSNSDTRYFDLDLSAMNQTGFLDKYLSVEIDNVTGLYVNANPWPGNMWLMVDGSNQVVNIKDNQGAQAQIISDLLLPTTKISLQMNQGGVQAQCDEYFSIIVANYARNPYLSQVM